MRQNITSALIALIITVITFYFLNNSYKVVEEIEPIKIPEVDQDFIDDIMQLRIQFNKGLENNRIPLSVNYLRFPPHLQCTLLTSVYRETLANKLELFSEGWLKYSSPDKFARLYLEEYDQVKRLCDYLRTEPEAYKYRADFLAFIKNYDERRGKNFKDTFPELIRDIERWND